MPAWQSLKAAQVLLKPVEARNPPTRLFLGMDALDIVDRKLEQMTTEIVDWEAVCQSTSFAD